MHTTYQDLDWITNKTVKLFRNNPNRSISAAFKYFRSQPRLSFIGDYPILAILIHTILSLGIKPTRYRVIYAYNKSDELRSFPLGVKSADLDHLLNCATDQMDRAINAKRLTNSQGHGCLVTK